MTNLRVFSLHLWSIHKWISMKLLLNLVTISHQCQTIRESNNWRFHISFGKIERENRATYPHTKCLNTWTQRRVARFDIDWLKFLYVLIRHSPCPEQRWLMISIDTYVHLKKMKKKLDESTILARVSPEFVPISTSESAYRFGKKRFVYPSFIYILHTLYDIVYTKRNDSLVLGTESKVSTRISFSSLFYCISLRMTCLLCTHIRNVGKKRERERERETEAEN